MSSFLEVAIDAAKIAGAHQLNQLHSAHTIQFKGPINLVTEVDKACEELIIKKIRSSFPDHNIVAEEGGGGDQKKSDYRWIIDPLDGTTNYAHAYPLFCVSIGLECQGEIILGVVFDPNRNELFHAEKGKGSFLNGKKIAVSQVDQLIHAMVATGFAYNVREARDNNLNHFSRMIQSVQAVRRDGVAAVDLCYVACGRYDGFWELNLFSWDVAAGMIILEEAGGRTSLFSGKKCGVDDKEILATNGLIHQEMVKVLTDL